MYCICHVLITQKWQWLITTWRDPTLPWDIDSRDIIGLGAVRGRTQQQCSPLCNATEEVSENKREFGIELLITSPERHTLIIQEQDLLQYIPGFLWAIKWLFLIINNNYERFVITAWDWSWSKGYPEGPEATKKRVVSQKLRKFCPQILKLHRHMLALLCAGQVREAGGSFEHFGGASIFVVGPSRSVSPLITANLTRSLQMAPNAGLNISSER